MDSLATKRFHEGLREAVRSGYDEKGFSCTLVILDLLGRYFDSPVPEVVMHGASGLHGAGRYGAQCGLVEGGLIFIALRAQVLEYNKQQIENVCSAWAAHFERCFGSLICRELRPEGFGDSVPPNRCLDLTVSAIKEASSQISPLFKN